VAADRQLPERRITNSPICLRTEELSAAIAVGIRRLLPLLYTAVGLDAAAVVQQPARKRIETGLDAAHQTPIVADWLLYSYPYLG